MERGFLFFIFIPQVDKPNDQAFRLRGRAPRQHSALFTIPCFDDYSARRGFTGFLHLLKDKPSKTVAAKSSGARVPPNS
jgi:hypothetical protein